MTVRLGQEQTFSLFQKADIQHAILRYQHLLRSTLSKETCRRTLPNGTIERCPKWTVLIVVLLGDGAKRFNEIKRMVGGISQRMLAFTLRGLERDGLVTRTVYPTTPPRVEYELTKLGGTLWTAVEPLSSWAREHVIEILASRGMFDDNKD